MRKLLVFALVVSCTYPAFVSASFNDVTLTTDAIILVGGYSLNVSGSSAEIQSIVVSADSFAVTLSSGSSFKVSSPSLQKFSTDVTSAIAASTCNSSESSLTLSYSGADSVTNTITPLSAVCQSVSSGGGGGSISFPGYQASTPTVTSTTTGTTSNTVGIPSVKIGGLTSAQIQGIIALLASFGADQSTINNITNVLNGQSPMQVSGQVSVSGVFTRDLELGDTGEDVRALQVYLNEHGFRLSSSGPGSPGSETTTFGNATKYQLTQFQKKNNITPAAGYFGPKTRSFISKQ